MQCILIDLGTNSIRFQHLQFHSDQSIRILKSARNMVRLGNGFFKTSMIQEEALQRTVTAIKKFLPPSSNIQIYAYTTCAVREAKNQEYVLQSIKDETGVQFIVLSGQDEARLIHKGIIQHSPLSYPHAFIDIGGGSAEIGLQENISAKPVYYSFPLGSARIHQTILKQSPPSLNDTEKLIKHSQKFFSHIKPSKVQNLHLYGTSGTVKGLSKILSPSNVDAPFSLPALQKLNQTMKTMNRSQLLKIPHMEEKRVDMLLGGSLILEELIKTLSVTNIQYLPFALKDGLFLELFKQDHNT